MRAGTLRQGVRGPDQPAGGEVANEGGDGTVVEGGCRGRAGVRGIHDQLKVV